MAINNRAKPRIPTTGMYIGVFRDSAYDVNSDRIWREMAQIMEPDIFCNFVGASSGAPNEPDNAMHEALWTSARMWHTAFSPENAGGCAVFANGSKDADIKRWAKKFGDYAHPVFFRLAWEFNGTWYTWSMYDSAGNQRTGNTPTDYINMWKKFRDIFAEYAPNVAFVWNPYLGGVQGKPSGSTLVPQDWYPGDAYVDWIGISPYAAMMPWVDLQANMTTWCSFATSHDKPVMLAEYSIVNDTTGDVSTHINNLNTFVAANPVIKAHCFFHQNKGTGKNYLLLNRSYAASLWRNGPLGEQVESDVRHVIV